MEEIFVPEYNTKELVNIINELIPINKERPTSILAEEEYTNGFKYKGGFRKFKSDCILTPKRHGKGTLNNKIPINNFFYKYEGKFKKDDLDLGTYAKILSSNNKIIMEYIGAFVNNYFEGNGILKMEISENKNFEYKGKFKNGLFNGEGTLQVFENGKIIMNFIGIFENGKLNDQSNVEINKNDKTFYKLQGSIKHGKKNGNIFETFSEKDNKINPNGLKQSKGIYKNGNIKKGELLYLNDDKYIGDLNENKYDGFGKFYLKGHLSYEGNYKLGKKNGNGIFYYLNNDKYIGEFKDDKEQGNGKYILSNNICKYDGQFKNGLYDGQGVLSDDEGNKIYIGGFKKGKYNGKGTLYRKKENGEGVEIIYFGDYIMGRKNGYGKVIYKNGDIYEGGFKNDKREGLNCKYIWKIDDKKFIGEFKEDNLFYGILEKKGIEGFKYEGEFVKGKIEGKGIYTNNKLEESAESIFKDGKFMGPTTRIFKNGLKYQMDYKNGIPTSLPKIIYKNNDTFDFLIDFKSDDEKDTFISKIHKKLKRNKLIRNLKGIYKFNSGGEYIGKYKENYKNDFNGVVYYKNGDKYEGELRSGKRNGKGIYTYANGAKFLGEWINGIKNGYGKYIEKDQELEGNFIDGKINGIGIRTFKSTGKKYKQKYINGIKVKEYRLGNEDY